MGTGTFMKETGSMTRLTVLEFTLIWMELSMKEIGKKTSNVAMEKNLGQMGQFMKEIIRMERNMDLEFSNGLMVQNIRDISLTTILKGTGYIFGLMDESTMGNGLEIKCMA